MTLRDKPEYTNYRKNFKHKQHKIKGRDNYFKFLGQFFDIIGEQLIENENGVFIEDLGYFFNWLCPKRMVRGVNGHEFYNFETDMRIYIPVFYPMNRNSEWTMDKSFSASVKKSLHNAIVKRNKRYKMHLTYLRKKL